MVPIRQQAREVADRRSAVFGANCQFFGRGFI
jgi:hypothetical protein